MRLPASALVTAFLLAGPQHAQASLAKSEGLTTLFEALADLTRPASQKRLPAGANTFSLSSDPRQSGVQWSVQQTQPTVLEDGKLNVPDFKLVTQGEKSKSAQSPAAASPDSASTSTSASSNPGITNAKQAFSSSSFYPVNPPSFPLAVRSPYFNAWLPSGSNLDSTPPNTVGNGGYLAGQWPSFWTSSYGADGEYRLGWSGYIRIDNVTYEWMGNGFGTLVRAGSAATQLSAEYTATRTMFTFEADKVKFNVTFLTPITPDDYLRQSLPLSYLHVELDKSTIKGRSIQLYTDIDERWVTGHDFDYENYAYDQQYYEKDDTSVFFVTRKRPQIYTEYRQRAEWGNATYAARNHTGLSSRNNNNVVVHTEFIERGELSFDHGPVGGPDNSFAFAIDFDAKHAEKEALFVVGHMRTPYVNYIRAKYPGSNSTKSYQEDRYGYWQTKFGDNLEDAVAFFMNDFESALEKAKAFDKQVLDDSRAAVGGGEVGDKYAAITQLSLRQAFATFEITVSKDSKGKYNTSDTLLFLKEISSNGDMSTVDVIFPLFPLLSYTNPDLLRDLMLPIFEYTKSGLYPNKWCVHDLGTYPNAFGYNDGNDEPMQVEESGNMIWMTLHWAQLVGKDKAVPFLTQHYDIMKQWTEFLVEDSLIPAEQLSTDDFAGTLANQTDLAIKGISAIAAMGRIADIIGHNKDAKSYANISSTYIKLWQDYAISHDASHTKLAYQTDSSWGTLYNLLADRLLDLNLVPHAVYKIQDGWYPRVQEKYGVPLDSRHKWSKTDWEMFAAAASDDPATHKLFIDLLYAFIRDGKTDAPFTDLMESTTGDFPKQPEDPLIHFLARPVVGGHFSFLAKAKADKANGIAEGAYRYGDENDVITARNDTKPPGKDSKKQKPFQLSDLTSKKSNKLSSGSQRAFQLPVQA
ncbi:probable glutaminase A [Ustilago bromivora]|uniref:Probable glutaminase A n=1 Tax=Ustilago bromivora TaxID=307758 RepID=A0A1K0GZ11_9BASI|nr:probable glutaminase A [Ustilago bromivora]SYW80344.1 probable glutaminase A [Ustilago bromivora]